MQVAKRAGLRLKRRADEAQRRRQYDGTARSCNEVSKMGKLHNIVFEKELIKSKKIKPAPCGAKLDASSKESWFEIEKACRRGAETKAVRLYGEELQRSKQDGEITQYCFLKKN